MCSGPLPAVMRTATLRGSGLSPSGIRDLVSAGHLDRLRRGVYARKGACAEIRRAATRGGGLACDSAARHLGMWILPPPDRLHVWLHGHGHSHPDDVDVVEHWDDGPAAGSFESPSVPRILRQILACHGVETFFVAVESARRLGLLDDDGMSWLRAHTNDEARAALALVRDDADSGIESLFRWRLRNLDLDVRTQVRIAGVGVVDALLADRLIVELDGRLNHDGPSERHRDLERDAASAMWGYAVLRFDYAMVVRDWPTVEAAVLSALARVSVVRVWCADAPGAAASSRESRIIPAGRADHPRGKGHPVSRHRRGADTAQTRTRRQSRGLSR